MIRFAAASAFLILACTCVAADEKGTKELEGTYKVLSAEVDGKAAEKAILDIMTVTIKGDEFVLVAGPNEKKVAKIKVKPDAKLSTIDFIPQDGPEKDKTFPGIYKLEKGELTVVLSEKDDRPKEFKAGENVMLLQLKKIEK